MKLRFLPIAIALLYTASVAAQYRFTPSTQIAGNPGQSIAYYFGDDFQYLNYSAPGATTAAVWQSPQTIPFPFYFNGTLVTSFKASTNGIVTFDTATTIIPPNSNAMLPNRHIPDKSICICGAFPASGSTQIIITPTNSVTNPANQQLWVSYICLVDSGSQTSHLWSIVLEENTNNIYLLDQFCTARGSLKLTLGIQVDTTMAYVVPGSPNITDIAGGSEYSTDNYFYAFEPGSPLISDGSVTATNLPSYLGVNRAPFTVKSVFKNLGTDTIHSLTMNYRVNGGSVVSENFSGLNIANGYEKWFAFTNPFNPTSAGNYNLDIWASNLSSGTDRDTTNDHFVQAISISLALPFRRALCEEFKGTWCGNSGYWTAQYDTLLRHNFRTSTTIHYEESPVNWTYDRNQISNREYNTYGQGYIPISVVNGMVLQTVGLNGQQGNYPGCPWNLTQDLIDSVALLPGLFFLHPQLAVKNDTVTIKVTSTAAVSLASNANCRLLVALVEDSIISATDFAPGNSYETQLYNTVRIMFPSITSGLNQGSQSNSDTGIFIGHPVLGHVDSVSFTYVISDTTCHPSRLHATVFVQDTLTHEIYQSAESDIPYTSGLQPLAKFTAPVQRICTGGQATIQNNSIAATGFKWAFPGAASDTSTAQNPVVSYHTPGLYNVTLVAINQYGTDTLTQSQYILVMDTAVDTLRQSFEAGILPADWWVRGNDPNVPIFSVDSGWSAYSHGHYCLRSNYDYSITSTPNTTQQGDVILPEMNLTTTTNPFIKYDYSLLFLNGIDDTIMRDSLFILISTDCGTTYQTLYLTGRDSLITSTRYNFNNYPDSSQWRTRVIDLSAYQGYTNVQILFRYIQYGYALRWTYLDNIQINGQQVHPHPIAGFTASHTAVCQGATVSFSNTSSSSTGYNWVFPGGLPDTSTSASPVITYNAPGTWPVTLIAVNGSYTDTLSFGNYVTTYSKPIIMATAVNNGICAGDTVTLTASGAQSYHWSPASGLSGTNISNPVAEPGQSTLYTVTGTDANNCTASASVDINVGVPRAIHLGVDTAVCDMSPVRLDAGNGFSSYLWSTGDTSEVITALTTGFYYVTATESGCKSTGSIAVYEINCNVGINEVGKALLFDIYPNPVNEFMTVKVSNDALGGLLNITDATGRVIKTQAVADTNFNVTTTELSSGIYFVTLTGKQGQKAVKKIEKQ